MKEVVFLYAGWPKTHAFEPLFSSQCAFERSLVWVRSCFRECTVVVLSSQAAEASVRSLLNSSHVDSYKVLCKNEWDSQTALKEMSALTSELHAERAVFAFADCPFLDTELTKQVLECHEKYLAEYTFADGYPHGFSPEVIDSGSLAILSKLASERDVGKSPVQAEFIFNVMKSDLNAFEIESVVSEKDYRMLRLDFSCSTKGNTLSCKRLYESALDKKLPFTAPSLSDESASSPCVQRTVPAFYNVQIEREVNLLSLYNPYPQALEKKYGAKASSAFPKSMSLEAFRALVDDMASVSEEAVVSLSAFGEPLLQERLCDYVNAVTLHEGLSVLIETDGLLVTEERCRDLCEAGRGKLTWVVMVDSVSESMFNLVHPNAAGFSQGPLSAFSRTVSSVSMLQKYFPGKVYPQFLRMNVNEPELESFYRFWHDKSSPSGGNLVIQKYDWFCSLLPQEKPADLSPLNRIPCWHLKRDFTILLDGSVPFCREHILSSSVGNVFDAGIESVWNTLQEDFSSHLSGNYTESCRKCDEYYTFNF